MRRAHFFAALLIVATPLLQGAKDNPALTAAITLMKEQRVPEARDALLALLKTDPNNSAALWRLGQAYNKLQQREPALNTLEKAAELAPNDHYIIADYGRTCGLRAAELGLSLRALSLARKGRALLEKAVQLAPERIVYREDLIEFYKNAPSIAGGSLDKAYAEVEQIIRLNPARGAIIKATIQTFDKRYDEAIATCQAALRTEPDNYVALYTLGRIASDTGRELELGEKSLRRCLTLTPADNEPDHAGAYYRLALILEKRGKIEEARAALRQALVLEPSFTAATNALARLK